MSAFGEIGKLINLFTYMCLSLPFLILFLNLIYRIKRKDKIKRILVLTIISVIPLVIFSISDYNRWKKLQLSNVGTYYLTHYPNCENCKLSLLENNTYEVINDQEILEKGDWEYIQGSDYFFVELGEKRRHLGSGDYQYEDYKLKNK